jgi:amidase
MGLWQSFTTLLSGGTAWAMADWSRRLDRALSPQHFEPFVWAFAERGREVDAATYLLAVQDVQRHTRAIAAFFEDHDLWLTPTLGTPPVPLGTLVFEGDPIALRRKTAAFSPFTYISNATGQPAISLPMHWTPEGLPIGVQLVARYAEESLLLQVARQLEVACPWTYRRPPTLEA